MRAHLAAAVLGLAAISTASFASAQLLRAQKPRPAAAPPSLSFSPTNGKVGFHMVAGSHVAQSPCQPGGNLVGSFTVTGALPPGLNPPDTTVPRFGFDGTPGQPGDWDVVVVAHNVGCTGGAIYGDLTAYVHFHIDP